MKRKIINMEGITVEVPEMDEVGEQKRKELNDLARREYEDTGALVSVKLLDATETFLETAEDHLL